MSKTVEFFFDFGSPNAYLAHLVIPAVEARTGATFRYVPILLGGVFKATNNVSPAVALKGIRNKPEYVALETRRFLERYGVPGYQPNPYFPVNTLLLMRGAIVAEQQGFFERYVDEMYRHMWREPKKMDDPEVVAAALAESGLPVAAILEGVQQPEVKQRLIDNTEDAVARGVFGSPSFIVDGELYFGKEKLREIEDWVGPS
ncbi:MAG TPA: 2-hydroxychromene-2-carboxylate isomerase [Pseudomonadales bacterium]